MRRVGLLIGVVLMCLGSVSVAWGHGTVEMLLSSTATGSGALQIVNDFEAVVRLDFSASIGGESIYTGLIPAFDNLPADDATVPAYVLDPGTQLTVVVTAIDEGTVAMKIGTTMLEAAGDSVVLGTTPITHTHPQYQLVLSLPEGEFGEGRISFKLTTTSASYTESPIYTLKLSNGPLPPIDYDTTAYDSKSVSCQQFAGAQVRSFISKEFGYLKACLDKLQVLEAKAVLTTPPSNLAAAQAAAEKACADQTGSAPDGKTMLGKIAAAKAAAFSAIQKKCGTPNPPAIPASASGDFNDDAIKQQLGLAGCRTEELVASVYGEAKAGLEQFTARVSQGGLPLDEYFPCLYVTGAE